MMASKKFRGFFVPCVTLMKPFWISRSSLKQLSTKYKFGLDVNAVNQESYEISHSVIDTEINAVIVNYLRELSLFLALIWDASWEIYDTKIMMADMAP